MLQPKKCAICNTINDGSRHFCSKCGAFLSSTPVQQKKIHSVWEEEGGGGIVNDPFGADSQDSLMNTDPYGGGQAGSDVQSAGAQFGNVQQMQTRQGNLRNGNGTQTGNAQAGGYIVRCPQCGAVHPAPDKKLPNVCSKCFYFFQQGVDQVVLAANLQSTQNSQSAQGSSRFNSQSTQGNGGFNSQRAQGGGGFNHAQKGFGQGNGNAQAQSGLTFNNQNGAGRQQQTANNQHTAGQRTGQGPLAGRSALASSRPDDSRLLLLAISNKKMPPAEIAPQGDIIGEGGTVFRNLKTGIKLSLWHTPAGWYARAMQGNVLYNGLPMNVGFQKKLADGDMFSFDAGQFRVEIIG